MVTFNRLQQYQRTPNVTELPEPQDPRRWPYYLGITLVWIYVGLCALALWYGLWYVAALAVKHAWVGA